MDSKKQIKNVSSTEKTIRKGRRANKTTAIRKHAAEDGDPQHQKINGEKYEISTLVKMSIWMFKSFVAISEETKIPSDAVLKGLAIFSDIVLPVRKIVFSRATSRFNEIWASEFPRVLFGLWHYFRGHPKTP